MVTATESGWTEGRTGFGNPFRISGASSKPKVLVVCEHASLYIPDELDRLGLTDGVARSHVAWDPGALGVAGALAQRLPSVLIHGTISRLVYDCNRPPTAESAIPVRSEIFDIPGNQNLTREARAMRVDGIYEPFARAISNQIAAHRASLELLVTIHSFTPVFHGVKREVELGILHGKDDRFAQAMLHITPNTPCYDIRLNEPYAASDGVAHTLDLHGAETGLQSVMIEIRSNLIETEGKQAEMASYLAEWIEQTLNDLNRRECAS